MINIPDANGQDNYDANDWANLRYYQAANAMLPPASAHEERIVFMGNSITEGWLKSDPSFFAGKPYVNRGISGQTTPQMLIRFRQDVIDLHPTVVVLLAGTNDIAENRGPTTLEAIYENIISMAELAMVHDIRMVICSVLPAHDYPWRPDLAPAEKIYGEDGVHPNLVGYRFMEPLVEAGIAKALKRK